MANKATTTRKPATTTAPATNNAANVHSTTPPAQVTQASANGNGNAQHVVIYVAPNNKRGKSAVIYNAWQVGLTVTQCKAGGIRAEDVRFDMPRAHVILAHPSTPAAQAAVALYNGATGNAATQHKATLAQHMQAAQAAQAAALASTPRSYAPAPYTAPAS